MIRAEWVVLPPWKLLKLDEKNTYLQIRKLRNPKQDMHKGKHRGTQHSPNY